MVDCNILYFIYITYDGGNIMSSSETDWELGTIDTIIATIILVVFPILVLIRIFLLPSSG